MKTATITTDIYKYEQGRFLEKEDTLVVEEPLEIQLAYGEAGKQMTKSISVTMRTPGQDRDLALGFLFTEGIIRTYGDVAEISTVRNKHPESRGNSIRLILKTGIIPDMKKLDRHFYTTSSCGICGKTSLEAVETALPFKLSPAKPVNPDLINTLSTTLEKAQTVFSKTGGLHACGLFDADGKLLLLREDIGRHNAMDKLIGGSLQSFTLPLSDCIVLVSGRAGFELVQKALMAGIGTLAAVGAPSSLATELARKHKMNLIGFLRNGRYNQYTNYSISP